MVTNQTFEEDIIDDKENPLQEEINRLKKENQYLKKILESNNIKYFSYDDFIKNENEKIVKRSVTIKNEIITKEHVNLFYSLFKGRRDVYAKRGGKPNSTGKIGYYSQCYNFWKAGLCPKFDGKKVSCSECDNKQYKPLTGNDIQNHLLGLKEDGSDVIGLYPLFIDGTCNFLVFDFDNHEDKNQDYLSEVRCLRKICKSLNVPEYTERSRSGNGYHIWLFFEEPILASEARKFGDFLINKGCEHVNVQSFDYFDRMIPAQDNVPKDKEGHSGLGNLIALPLQGQAVLKQNSVFVDNDFVAYEDQWNILRNVIKIKKSFIQDFTKEEENESINENKPWDKRKEIYKEDFIGETEIVLSDKVYISTKSIANRSLNALRRRASLTNPEYYKNKALGFSNFEVPRIIYVGEDQDSYLCLPRGLKDEIISDFEEKEISYKVQDLRIGDNKIKVTFNGKLYEEQQDAIDVTLKYDTGIINAATSFGKTVVGAGIISKLKVNTLILVHNKEIQNHWFEDLKKFLVIDEPFPIYTTESGRKKERKSLIGTLCGGYNSLTSIVDIAMLPSLSKMKEFEELASTYSLILIDECHHSAAENIFHVLKDLKAKYVYGLTATIKREDKLDKLVTMAIGPVRYTYTSLERNLKQGIGHYVYPRFTRLSSIKDLDINEAYKHAISNSQRNEQIVSDIKECLQNKRTPLVLTKFKEHAAILYEQCKDIADEVYLLQGGGSNPKKKEIRNKLMNSSLEHSVLLIAIDKYVGEGFSFPRLDTLFLTMPIKWEGNVEQYAGRLQRDYEGKKEVIIYDYIDSNIRVLEKMYHHRLRTYKRIGYEICNSYTSNSKCENQFFDNIDYLNAFESDIVQANKEIILSSVGLSRYKVFRFLNLIKENQYKGVKVIVITLNFTQYPLEHQDNAKELIDKLKENGVIVKTKDFMYKHYAIIDNSLLWYGNMNLLSKEKQEDNMMRLVDEEMIQQIIESEAKQ